MSRLPKDVKAEVIAEAIDSAVKIAKIIEKDSRYDAEAYGFVLSSLHFLLVKKRKRRHVSGQELLEGIRQYGLRQFGPMTRTVLGYWGIKSTADFGEIVFNLVKFGLMRKSSEDSKDDFNNVYDFKKAFDRPYRLSHNPRISALKKYPAQRSRNQTKRRRRKDRLK